MEIDYSVVIRTTGKAGEKYAGLLESVAGLCPQPKEIIVVLPEGYNLPEERLGWEKFYYCPKGMVIQRMTGIAKCKTRYALICDDDVQFGPDFVQKLHKPIADGSYSFSAGPLYSFLPSGFGAMVDILTGASAPTVFHKERYCSVLKTTGFSYNRNLSAKISCYETQSAAWTCFYADVEVLKNIDFETEQIWLDKNGYSALDDQTMFYKAWLRGHKTAIVTEAEYVHLDGKTSTRNNREPALFASCFNRVVFWHRFIYLTQDGGMRKALAKVAFGYRRMWMYIYDTVDIVRKRLTKEEFKIKRNGIRQGYMYLKTDEYKSLPFVR